MHDILLRQFDVAWRPECAGYDIVPPGIASFACHNAARAVL